MTMPGFTAEYVYPAADTRSAHRVVPALYGTYGDTPIDRRADCMESCRDAGLSITECGKRCNPQLPPYQCTPQDNSVNHYLCLGAVSLWEAACAADCGLLKGVPGFGEFLAGACSAGCEAVAAQSRATCPPATICV